jgi:hypothetical protein
MKEEVTNTGGVTYFIFVLLGTATLLPGTFPLQLNTSGQSVAAIHCAWAAVVFGVGIGWSWAICRCIGSADRGRSRKLERWDYVGVSCNSI